MEHSSTTEAKPIKRLSNAGPRNGRAKTDWPTVERIRALYAGADNATATKIAREVGLSPRQVRRILRYEGWIR